MNFMIIIEDEETLSMNTCSLKMTSQSEHMLEIDPEFSGAVFMFSCRNMSFVVN